MHSADASGQYHAVHIRRITEPYIRYVGANGILHIHHTGSFRIHKQPGQRYASVIERAHTFTPCGIERTAVSVINYACFARTGIIINILQRCGYARLIGSDYFTVCAAALCATVIPVKIIKRITYVQRAIRHRFPYESAVMPRTTRYARRVAARKVINVCAGSNVYFTVGNIESMASVKPPYHRRNPRPTAAVLPLQFEITVNIDFGIADGGRTAGCILADKTEYPAKSKLSVVAAQPPQA